MSFPNSQLFKSEYARFPLSEVSRKAVHESGHAMMAMMSGLGVEYVSIIRDGWYDGFCRLDDRVFYTLEWLPYKVAREFALTMVAGREAERLLLASYGLALFPSHKYAWDEDARLACKAAVSLGLRESEILGFLSLLSKEAAVKLVASWHGTTAIASALMRFGRLTGKEVENVVGFAMANNT